MQKDCARSRESLFVFIGEILRVKDDAALEVRDERLMNKS
jgi:hypothetical protein